MEISTLLTAVIAFCAVFSALGLMFGILLSPMRRDMIRIEKDLKAEIRELRTLIIAGQSKDKQADI